MNTVKVFDSYDRQALTDFENTKKTYDGFVYIIEVGNSTKIGCTAHLDKRMRQLSSMLRNYADIKIGRIAVTMPHMNYRDNEKTIHKIFSSSRINGGEMFDVKFCDAILELNSLSFDTSDELRNARMKEADRGFEILKALLLPRVGNERR